MKNHCENRLVLICGSLLSRIPANKSDGVFFVFDAKIQYYTNEAGGRERSNLFGPSSPKGIGVEHVFPYRSRRAW